MTAAANPFNTAVLRDARASFIDVPARMVWLKSHPKMAELAAKGPDAESCASASPVNPPQAPMVIPPRYASGNHGPVNPSYEATVTIYRDFESTASTLANRYVSSGDPRYAACLLSHLDRWAQANALTDYDVRTEKGASNQVWYQTEWSAAAAALALS